MNRLFQRVSNRVAAVALGGAIVLAGSAAAFTQKPKSESFSPPPVDERPIRVAMIIAAVIFLGLTRKENREALGLTVSLRWIAIAVLVGFAMGFGNPGGFDPTQLSAIVLALFHTFATELFFRGYIFKTLSASMKSSFVPILLSSLCYGLFYLTTAPIWARPFLVKTLLVILFSAVGAVYAYAYKRSGSFLVPWMMHFFSVLKYQMLF